ncbi:MAG: Clp protease ClpP [Alcaligenaceae bacterium]|nr:Clp protease ClpP [Alcaligenaceae bacterium SAGV5]MPS50447.1 Clp protease ClpP [Alcaligenaceae bacterium SAGV3]MPT57892.1 Clp protease ClpP [Alcaligenaceae bacterium]
MAKKRWYSMRASVQAGERVAELRIYEEIGFWGMTAKQFMDELDAVVVGAARLVVSINSPGGDVFDAFAIYNALRRLQIPVSTRVDGVAASAASLIFMAGEERPMPDNAMLMIHNMWTIVLGSSEELRKQADMMDKATEGVLAAYARSGQDEAEIQRMMDETTWMTALEAQALGFCTMIEEPVKLAASGQITAVLARHKGVPAAFLAELEEAEEPEVSAEPPAAGPGPAPKPPDPAPAGDPPTDPPEPPAEQPNAAAIASHVYAACREHKIAHLAEGIIVSGALASQEQADERITQAREIAGLCLAAKLPEMAVDFITTGLGVEAVRARLFDSVVRQSADNISNVQRPPESGAGEVSQSTMSTSSIYAARASARRRR